MSVHPSVKDQFREHKSEPTPAPWQIAYSATRDDFMIVAGDNLIAREMTHADAVVAAASLDLLTAAQNLLAVMVGTGYYHHFAPQLDALTVAVRKGEGVGL